MKNYTLLLLVAAASLSFTACNKTYNCQCVNGATSSVVYTGTVRSYSEHTARPQCDTHSSESITCTLSR